MKVLIGVDPHKGSHTAVAIDHDEVPLVLSRGIPARVARGHQATFSGSPEYVQAKGFAVLS